MATLSSVAEAISKVNILESTVMDPRTRLNSKAKCLRCRTDKQKCDDSPDPKEKRCVRCAEKDLELEKCVREYITKPDDAELVQDTSSSTSRRGYQKSTQTYGVTPGFRTSQAHSVSFLPYQTGYGDCYTITSSQHNSFQRQQNASNDESRNRTTFLPPHGNQMQSVIQNYSDGYGDGYGYGYGYGYSYDDSSTLIRYDANNSDTSINGNALKHLKRTKGSRQPRAK